MTVSEDIDTEIVDLVQVLEALIRSAEALQAALVPLTAGLLILAVVIAFPGVVYLISKKIPTRRF